MSKRGKILLTVVCTVAVLVILLAVSLSIFGFNNHYGSVAREGRREDKLGDSSGYETRSIPLGEPVAMKGQGNGMVTENASKLPEMKKLIVNISMEIKTKSFDEDLKKLNQAGVDGFYIEASNLKTKSNGLKSAYFVFRVPSDKLKSFMEQLNNVGAVANIEKNVKDVSSEYFDTKGRLETQQTMLTRLNELMAKAQYVEDMLKIEEKISEVQYNIDRLSGRLKGMDKLVDFATVSVSLNELKQPEIVEVEKSFFAKLKLSFKNGIDSFADFMADLMLAITWLLPRILFIAIIIVIVILIVKRIKRRKNK